MAKSNLVNSCSECLNPCCKTGPGPYTVVDKEVYLESYGTYENLNRKCEGFTRNGKCRFWGTKNLPEACRTHVCTNKKYTSDEIFTISTVVSKICPNCGANYMMEYAEGDQECVACEACKYIERWVQVENKQEEN